MHTICIPLMYTIRIEGKNSILWFDRQTGTGEGMRLTAVIDRLEQLGKKKTAAAICKRFNYRREV